VKVPKYYLVKTRILELIGDLVPGDVIPPERDLAERFDTSRTTVRQAIAELVVEGRLERTQGSGTFVAPPKAVPVRPLTSFSQDLAAEGSRPGAIVLEVCTQAASAEAAERLGVGEGDPITRVERVRTAGDVPLALERAHLPGELDGLADALAERASLYRTLREVYGRAVATVEDVVETSLASPREADLLDVETGTPMLLVHRTAWDVHGEPVEWTRSVFRGDRFAFVARQRLDPDPG